MLFSGGDPIGLSSLSISMNTNEIFSQANDVIEAMMAVVYIVAGISLGFVVVSKIISAFR